MFLATSSLLPSFDAELLSLLIPYYSKLKPQTYPPELQMWTRNRSYIVTNEPRFLKISH